MAAYLFGDVVVDDEEARLFDGERQAVKAGPADDGGVGQGSPELDVAGVGGDGSNGGGFVRIILALQSGLHFVSDRRSSSGIRN